MRSRTLVTTICATLFFLAAATAGIAAAPPGAASPELTVDVTRMLYQCQMRGYDYTIAPGITDSLKGYRSFEIDANITNRSNKPVEILLKPARWIITDGTRDVISDLAWEYVSAPSTTYAYKQLDDVLKRYAVPRKQITQWQAQGKTVTLQPGGSVAQTFIAFPLGKGEWVKGVDFAFNGQTYHQDFDIDPYGTDHNYVQDCGVWAPGPDLAPTPTPGLAALAIKPPAPQPTRAVAVARAVTPKAPAQPLQVDITRIEYQCPRSAFAYEVAPGINWKLDGYRTFEIDTYVTNRSDKPVDILFKPARWTITNGKSDAVSDLVWEWGPATTTTVMKTVSVDGVEQRLPFEVETRGIVKWSEQGKPTSLAPGQSAARTFLAYPLDPGEWVEGVDFVLGGRTYHKSFDIGQSGAAYNYGQDCGVWVPSADRQPTPTPGPAAAAMGLPATRLTPASRAPGR
jgi:hypothetical protein